MQSSEEAPMPFFAKQRGRRSKENRPAEDPEEEGEFPRLNIPSAESLPFSNDRLTEVRPTAIDALDYLHAKRISRSSRRRGRRGKVISNDCLQRNVFNAFR